VGLAKLIIAQHAGGRTSSSLVSNYEIIRWPDLNMHFHIDIAVGISRFLAAALRVVIVVIHHFQMLHRPVLAQAVIHAHQDHRGQPQPPGDLKKLLQQVMLESLLDRLHRPGSFTE